MDLEKLQRDLKSSYKKNSKNVDEKVKNILKHIEKEWGVKTKNLNLPQMKTIVTSILDIETKELHNEVESLLAQKEQIERKLEKKATELQDMKYSLFNAIESQLDSDGYKEVLSKLHQVKLQSIDLFDLLSEMVESALITTLEKDKDGDIKATTEEVVKALTFEAIKEGSLSTIRVRKILSTILQSAIDVAEATPTRANEILKSTLKGMRSGLVQSIHRFKKRLAYMPIEAKHILIEDYDTIIEDLNQTDILFSQVVQTQANESSNSIRKLLVDLKNEMKYDLDELVNISKEAADVMKERFSFIAKTAVKKSEKVLQSPTAKEAQRMGKQVWGVAKNALDNALKSAKGNSKSKEK
jgi:hypothetical protein